MTMRRRAEHTVEPPARRAGGFTLIEMMTAILILAILVGLAVPSFNNASLSGKLTGFANDLLASSQLARSEAIKRNVAVTLCASSDGSTCDDPEGWETGWIVVADPGGLNERVIQQYPELPGEFRVRETLDIDTLVFPATVAGATVASFTVCRTEPAGNQTRRVLIGASGGARVEQRFPPADVSCPD